MTTADDLFASWSRRAKHFADGGSTSATGNAITDEFGISGDGSGTANKLIQLSTDPLGMFGTSSANPYEAQAQASQFKGDQNTPYGDYRGAAAQNADMYNQQSQFNNQLRDQIAGKGPSLAQMQLNQATQANTQQAAGQAASQRGMNPALAQRMAMQNQANANQQASGQSAQLRAQEQLSATGMLGQNLQAQRAGTLQQYGNAGQGYLGAQQLNQQTGAQNAQLDMEAQGINAQTAQANSKNQNGIMGGIMGGMGSSMSMADGGEVPQHFAQGGITNRAVPLGTYNNGGASSMMGPGMILAMLMQLFKSKQKDRQLQPKSDTSPGYREPGAVTDAAQLHSSPMLEAPARSYAPPSADPATQTLNRGDISQLEEPTLGASYFHPQSAVTPGRLEQPDPSVLTSQADDGAANRIASMLHESYAGGSGGDAMAEPETFDEGGEVDSGSLDALSGSEADSQGSFGAAESAFNTSPLQAGAQAMASPAPMQGLGQSAAPLPLATNNSGTSLAGSAAKALGGIDNGKDEKSQNIGTIASIIAMLDHGGEIPGEAKEQGDDPANDTVPAVLSPGEIVLPRSVAQAPDAAQRAADFVSQLKQEEGEDEGYGAVLRKEHKLRSVKAKHMDEGGDVSSPEAYKAVHDGDGGVLNTLDQINTWYKENQPKYSLAGPIGSAVDWAYEKGGLGDDVRGAAGKGLDYASAHLSPEQELFLRSATSHIGAGEEQLNKFGTSPRGLQAVNGVESKLGGEGYDLPPWLASLAQKTAPVRSAALMAGAQAAPDVGLQALLAKPALATLARSAETAAAASRAAPDVNTVRKNLQGSLARALAGDDNVVMRSSKNY